MNAEKNKSADNSKGSSLALDKEEILLRKYFLKGKTIGISISESDDLPELGYGVAHLKDVVMEIARYILATGGTLAYGGDMRLGGFTELIFELLLYYKADQSSAPQERFYSFLAFPISTTLSQEKEAELRQNVSFKKIDPPEELGITNLKEFLKPDTVNNLYIWTRCLTKMREEMEAICQARIFIGGKTKGFKGRCPGILEEFLIAIKQKHPVYLIGTFGGITHDMIEALKGSTPDSLTEEYYIQNADYKSLFSYYNEKHPEAPINFSLYLSALQGIGLKGLSELNGLNEEDNLRLAITPHLSEIVFLILKGMTNCFTK